MKKYRFTVDIPSVGIIYQRTFSGYSEHEARKHFVNTFTVSKLEYNLLLNEECFSVEELEI